MNIVQFNALKPGDRIENAMSGSTGEVVEADSKGVTVKWTGSPGKGISGAGVLRHYSRFSTIWFHWSLFEAPSADDEAIERQHQAEGEL